MRVSGQNFTHQGCANFMRNKIHKIHKISFVKAFQTNHISSVATLHQMVFQMLLKGEEYEKYTYNRYTLRLEGQCRRVCEAYRRGKRNHRRTLSRQS